METVDTDDEPVEGYEVGDKYLDFVINSKDNSSTAEHLYVLVSDLIDTYTADNSTLALSNNQFSVKAGGITSTELASAINTSLGYADAYHSSPAAGISSSDITNWDGKPDLSDVDDEIEDVLDALTTALSS